MTMDAPSAASHHRVEGSGRKSVNDVATLLIEKVVRDLQDLKRHLARDQAEADLERYELVKRCQKAEEIAAAESGKAEDYLRRISMLEFALKRERAMVEILQRKKDGSEIDREVSGTPPISEQSEPISISSFPVSPAEAFRAQLEALGSTTSSQNPSPMASTRSADGLREFVKSIQLSPNRTSLGGSDSRVRMSNPARLHSARSPKSGNTLKSPAANAMKAPPSPTSWMQAARFPTKENLKTGSFSPPLKKASPRHGTCAGLPTKGLKEWHSTARVNAHLGAVRSCMVVDDGKTLLTGSEDAIIKVWHLPATIDSESDTTSPREITLYDPLCLRGGASGILSMAYREDDRAIVAGRADGVVSMYRLPPLGVGIRALSPRREINALVKAEEVCRHEDSVWSVRFGKTEDCLLATSSSDGTACVWKISAPNGNEDVTFLQLLAQRFKLVEEGKTVTPSALCWHPSDMSNKLIIGFVDGTVGSVDIHTGKFISRTAPLESGASITCLEPVEDGAKCVFAGCSDGSVRCIDIDANVISGGGDDESEAAITGLNAEKWEVAGTSLDGYLRFWDMRKSLKSSSEGLSMESIGDIDDGFEMPTKVLQLRQLNNSPSSSALLSLHRSSNYMAVGGIDGRVDLLI